MKTRRFLGWVAMATMVLSTGCSNDEVVNDFSQDNAIEFGTYVGRDAVSRASVITTENLKGASSTGFGVFAYYTAQNAYKSGDAFDPNFMKNEQVQWNTTNNKWEYSPLKYWPNNAKDKVSFIAYAPWQDSFSLDDTGNGKYTYTVADEVTSQIDLLWSKSQNFNITKQSIDGDVKFEFAHALSKIGFTINAGIDLTEKGGKLDENTTIYVDKVTLGSLYSKGTMDMSKATAEWSDRRGDVTYTWDYVNDGTANELQNNTLTSTTEFGTGKEKQLIKDDAYLMTIPQKDKTITVTVTYRVFTKDENLTVPMNGNTALVPEQPNVKGSLVTNVIPVEISDQTFDPGKQYTYHIILGMTSVKVSAEVNPWEDGNSGEDWYNENTSSNNP